MATQQPIMRVNTRYHEMHLGHWHQKKVIGLQRVEPYHGIRLRIVPSLSLANARHRMKGYDGLSPAEACLWDKEQATIGSFAFNY